MSRHLRYEQGGTRWILSLGWLASIGCRGAADLVAAAPGDYDPNHPPQVLELSGALEVHDPTIFGADGKHFVYHSGPGLLVKSSTDLHEFVAESPVFDANPSWIGALVPDATDLWSPAMADFGGRTHLYYAASVFQSTRSCIGHATRTPAGSGFTDQGWIVCSNVTEMNDFNAIDPAVFVDGDGEAWMTFGSYGSGIKLIALAPSGARFDSNMVDVAARPAADPEIQQSFLTKRDSFYYLFVSFDTCCKGAASDHRIMVGRATSVTGPYRDRDGVDMMVGGGTEVLVGNERWHGPGSNAIYSAGNERYNVYHAYDAEANGRATLRIAQLRFDDEGWPVSGGP